VIAEPAAYDRFLASKVLVTQQVGESVPRDLLLAALKPFQGDIVLRALLKGRFAIFAECGLGKTPMQLEWARQVVRLTGGRVLILAPLAVAIQTAGEAAKFGIDVRVVRSQAEVMGPGIYVTNYELLEAFDVGLFVGVVLDESSILKNYVGATKTALVERFAGLRWKLCCTATPAPNDYIELGNHAQFLEVMDPGDMLTRWFTNDPMEARNLRLKRHAEDDFWRWVTTWAVYVEKPSDLGDYSDDGYVLPELSIVEHVVDVDESAAPGSGALFRDGQLSATNVHGEMRLTAAARAARAADILRDVAGPAVVWCHTDYEADALTAAIPGAIEVRGSQSLEKKELGLQSFTRGDVLRLVTKPKIAGLGLNWQHCCTAVFVGLSYSYEALYQAIRRIWRFGQTRKVTVHVIRASTEGAVLASLQEKEARHVEMKAAMRRAVRQVLAGEDFAYARTSVVEYGRGAAWRLVHGDNVEALAHEPANSVGLTVTSPPFSNVYTYSDQLADMGNAADDEQFLEHFGYTARGLHRVMIPGRIVALHCKDLPLYKTRDGTTGLRDFPGDLLRVMTAAGFTFHSRVTIWKCPVIEMQRTKPQGLLYKQLRADSSLSRQGVADYVIAFRKWDGLDENSRSAEPVTHTEEEFPLEEWRQVASPVWMDIRQTNVLDYEEARDPRDERHICPLQLDVIERCIRLWSKPGDLVLDPFMGVGSTGFQALKMGRRALGVELKPSYAATAAKMLARAERDASAPTLFGAVA
jgi:hypothetical protein